MEKEVLAIMQAWFDEERGNRVTSNNFQTLVNKVGAVITQAKKELENKDAA